MGLSYGQRFKINMPKNIYRLNFQPAPIAIFNACYQRLVRGLVTNRQTHMRVKGLQLFREYGIDHRTTDSNLPRFFGQSAGL
jgi:hypothetical protein